MRRALPLRFLVLVPVAAVAAASAFAATAVASPASPNGLPAKLVGCWRRPVNEPGLDKGVWSMWIKKDGTLVMYYPGTTCASTGPNAAPDFISTVAAAGQQLTIGTLPVCQSTANYSWKLTGAHLTLRAVTDKGCVARRELFIGTWTRK